MTEVQVHPVYSVKVAAVEFADSMVGRIRGSVDWLQTYRDNYACQTKGIPVFDQAAVDRYLAELDAEVARRAVIAGKPPAPVAPPGEAPRGYPHRLWVCVDKTCGCSGRHAYWWPHANTVRRAVRVPCRWQFAQHPRAGPALADCLGAWLSATEAWELAQTGGRGFSLAPDLDTPGPPRSPGN